MFNDGNLHRWCPGSGKENISKWEPLGLGAGLLVTCTGGKLHCTVYCQFFTVLSLNLNLPALLCE